MAQHQPVVLDAFGLHHAELKISLLPLCLLLFPGDSVRAVPRRSQILQEEQKTADAEQRPERGDVEERCRWRVQPRQQATDQRAGNRPDPSHAECAAYAIGAQRGR